MPSLVPSLVPLLVPVPQGPPCKWGLPHQRRSSFPQCKEVKPCDANAISLAFLGGLL